jgi:hypothetical protein
MATDFYKSNGSYYTAGNNAKVADVAALQSLSKAGGKEISVPTSVLKPASVAPSTTANAAAGQTAKAYNAKGEAVYVKPGEYNPGISLTNPTILNAEQQKATQDINAGQDATIKSQMEAAGDIPTVKGAIAEDQAILDEYGAKFGYDKTTTEKPAVVSLKDTYADLQKTYNTGELETQLTDLQKEQKDIEARTRARKEYEASKPVAMGVISGKQSEIEKQEAELLDANLRQQDYLTNQLKNKYSTIETMMNLTQKDYENSVSNYDKQFSQNMQVMNYLKGVEETVNTKANQVRDDARANLTIITNAITSGGMTYDDLPATTKTQISKYEIMAGLPTGFTKALQNKNPKSDILSTTTRQEANGSKYADILTRDQSGKISVQSIYLGKEKLPVSSSGGETKAEIAEREKLARRDLIKADIASVAGSDDKVDPAKMIMIARSISKDDPDNWTWFKENYSPAEMLNEEYADNEDLIMKNKWF